MCRNANFHVVSYTTANVDRAVDRIIAGRCDTLTTSFAHCEFYFLINRVSSA